MCRDPQRGKEDQWGIDITSTHARISFFFPLSAAHSHKPGVSPLTEMQTVSDNLISWQPSSPRLLIRDVGGGQSWLLRPESEILSYLTFNTARLDQVKVYSSLVTRTDLIQHTEPSKKGKEEKTTVHRHKRRMLAGFFCFCMIADTLILKLSYN